MQREEPHRRYIRYVPSKRNLLLISKVHTWLYLITKGFLGTRVDGLDILLLDTIGRKSKLKRTTPMPYFEHEGGYLLVASNASSEVNPSWFFNLKAAPSTRIRVGKLSTNVDAVVVDDTLRDELWEILIGNHPRYLAYQNSTQRKIPMVYLVPSANSKNSP